MDDEPELRMSPANLKKASAVVLEVASFMLPEAAGSLKIDLSDSSGLRVTIRRVAKRTRKPRKHDS